VDPKDQPPIETIKIGDINATFTKQMKALGIIIQGNLSWEAQGDKSIKKGKMLISNLKVLRKYLTKDQFLKVASSNYFGTVFYASSVWLHSLKVIQLTKLNSLHYRLLRTAMRDFRMRLSKEELTTACKKATPMQWARYITGSRVVKIIRDKAPKNLYEILMKNYFEESRKPGLGMFFDTSKKLIGKQSLENRLFFMRTINEPWNEISPKLNDDQIRILMKKSFFPSEIYCAIDSVRFDMQSPLVGKHQTL